MRTLLAAVTLTLITLLLSALFGANRALTQEYKRIAGSWIIAPDNSGVVIKGFMYRGQRATISLQIEEHGLVGSVTVRCGNENKSAHYMYPTSPNGDVYINGAVARCDGGSWLTRDEENWNHWVIESGGVPPEVMEYLFTQGAQIDEDYCVEPLD